MSIALERELVSRYRWTVLGVATFTQASACFFVQGIGAVGGFLQRDLNLSGAQLGMLISAAQLVPLIGLLVAGELLDRYSERWVVGVGTSMVGLTLLIGSLAAGYSQLLIVLLILGAGYSVAQPGGSKSVAAWFPGSQRGFAMGIRQAGLPLGGALAAAVLPPLAGQYGWRSSLLVGGLVSLIGSALFMTLYRTPEHSSPLPSRDSGKNLRSHLKSRFGMITEPAMVNIMLSGTSLISVQYGILVLTVLYLADTTGMSLARGALFLLVAQCAGIAGRITLAAWSDRCRSRYVPVVACMSAVVVGLAFLLVVPTQSLPVAGFLFAWLGFFGFGWYGPWVAYVAETAPAGKQGFALGLAMAVNQIAVILAPPVLGLLADMSGSYRSAWLLLMAMTLVALLASLWSIRRRHLSPAH
jgi:MFS family permease